jgi:hypothetical protein
MLYFILLSIHVIITLLHYVVNITDFANVLTSNMTNMYYLLMTLLITGLPPSVK